MKKLLVLTTAVIMSTLFASTVLAADWEKINNDWYYKENNTNITNKWVKYENNYYYLGPDGKMLTNTVVEDDDNLYYVNSSGARVSNEWRELDDSKVEKGWYYFGSDGKALTLEKSKLHTINGKRYIFDEDGLMLYGWIDEDYSQVDSYEDGVYYCGEYDDGAISEGWKAIDVDTDDDNYLDHYWFYFTASTGKKTINYDSRNINGQIYGFDENGVMRFGFSKVSEDSEDESEVAGYKYYNDYDNGSMVKSDWFYVEPDENIHSDAEDKAWFYANSNGTLKANTVASIKNQKYAFNEYGEMLYGLIGLKLDGSKIVEYTDIIEDEDELNALDDDFKVYYFGNKNDGSMKKNVQNIVLEGDSYTFNFSSNGEGKEGIYKNGIYVHGLKQKADPDYGLSIIRFDDKEYLVNTSGDIIKNKTNIKDEDGYYYCTDKDGIVTYKSSSKK